MTDSEITLSVLREIRDSIRTMDTRLSGRIDALNERVDRGFEQVDQRFEQMDQRFDQRFSVIERTLVDLSGQLVLVGRYLKNRTEVEIADLRVRVSKLEAKG